MFTDLRIHAALPAHDLARAQRFYEETLGLTPTDQRGHGVRYELGSGSTILVFPSSVTTRGGHTQAGLEVNDIDVAVRNLQDRGVTFEQNGDVHEADGSKAAWFKDTEGNLLVLVQFS
jgi:predicted enzyme related to lactoylglutathione lyase